MRKILIATHFRLAEGFRNALSYFTKSDCIYVINAFTENVDYQKEIDLFFQKNKENEILAFSDIAFGSVNQYLTTYLGTENYYLISGANLPVMLELLLLPENIPLTEELIAEKVEAARESLIFMNHFQRNNYNDEDE